MMSTKPTKQRTVALRHLLSRLWYRRDAPRWTIHGCDQHRRPVRVRVGFSDDGVTLDVPHAGPLVLAPLQAGRLRGAIRDALTAIDQPDAAAHCITHTPTAWPARTPPPTARPRKRLLLDDREMRTRPCVWAHSPLAVATPAVARPASNPVKEDCGGVG